MSDNGHIHHRIDYIEIIVTDLEESKKFYNSIFDWEFNDYAPNYSGIKKGNGEAGGLTVGVVSPGTGPLVVIYSRDIRSTLEVAKRNGAEIVKDIFEFPGGSRFHFKDPSGNELAVWTLC